MTSIAMGMRSARRARLGVLLGFALVTGMIVAIFVSSGAVRVSLPAFLTSPDRGQGAPLRLHVPPTPDAAKVRTVPDLRALVAAQAQLGDEARSGSRSQAPASGPGRVDATGSPSDAGTAGPSPGGGAGATPPRVDGGANPPTGPGGPTGPNTPTGPTAPTTPSVPLDPPSTGGTVSGPVETVGSTVEGTTAAVGGAVETTVPGPVGGAASDAAAHAGQTTHGAAGTVGGVVRGLGL